MKNPPKMSAYQKLHSIDLKSQTPQANKKAAAAMKETKQHNTPIVEPSLISAKTSGRLHRRKDPLIYPETGCIYDSRKGKTDYTASLRSYDDEFVYDSGEDSAADAGSTLKATSHAKENSESEDELDYESDQSNSVDAKKEVLLCQFGECTRGHIDANEDSDNSNMNATNSSSESKNSSKEDSKAKVSANVTVKPISGRFLKMSRQRHQNRRTRMNDKADEDWDESSIEDTIIAAGAKLALLAPVRNSLTKPTSLANEADDGAIVVDNSMAAKDNSSSGSGDETATIEDSSRQILVRGSSSSDDSESSLSEDTIVQTPGPEQVPDWFPKNIKKIYKIDHRGGALTFKELDEITRYRASLQITHRRKWKKYIEAGQARWRLQQILHRLRVRPMTKSFYTFRKKQYAHWKGEALRRWKKLEKLQRGVLLLDEKINTNFLMERMIYKGRIVGGQVR